MTASFLLRTVSATSIACLLAVVIQARTQKSAAEAKGTVEKIKVHGKSLEGNLEGDSPDRDVFVYLPPSYAKQTGRRYAVVYFLHGYSVNAEAHWKMMSVPDAAHQAMTAGGLNEMIVVHPDSFTVYDGSMYSNSLTTGDWEGYISQDLVSYIDGHYRTIATREARGLAGHSMGGYGTVRIGMKHPEVFSAFYAMSSCCLMKRTAEIAIGNEPVLINHRHAVWFALDRVPEHVHQAFVEGQTAISRDLRTDSR